MVNLPPKEFLALVKLECYLEYAKRAPALIIQSSPEDEFYLLPFRWFE